jgi:glycosyl-4,4'-diaponeurosporenoate acyltransferase
MVRILYLPPIDTFFLDVIAWVIIHLSIGYWSSRIPISWFNPKKPLYLTYAWEKSGEIYQTLFRVRSWKKFIPNGSALYPDGFSIKNLKSFSPEYVERWLRESCRAEFCHWMMIFPGFLFFLWNSVEGAWWMVFYAVFNNFFPIVLQRFNRPRIRRILAQVQRLSSQNQFLPTPNVYEPEKSYLNSYC